MYQRITITSTHILTALLFIYIIIPILPTHSHTDLSDLCGNMQHPFIPECPFNTTATSVHPQDPAPHTYHLPTTISQMRAHASREFPFWDDYNGFGHDNFSTLEAVPFSVTKLLSQILFPSSLTYIYDLMVFSSRLLVVTSCYFLFKQCSMSNLSSRIATTSYIFSSYAATTQQFPENTSYNMLPLLLLGTLLLRKHIFGIVIYATICALVFLSGHPESSAGYIIVSVLYYFFTASYEHNSLLRDALKLFCSSLLAMMLCSFIILPFIYTQAHQTSHLTVDFRFLNTGDTFFIVILPFLLSIVWPTAALGLKTSPAYLTIFVGSLGFPALFVRSHGDSTRHTRVLGFIALIMLALMTIVRPWGYFPGFLYFNIHYVFGTATLYLSLRVASMFHSMQIESLHPKRVQIKRHLSRPFLLFSTLIIAILQIVAQFSATVASTSKTLIEYFWNHLVFEAQFFSISPIIAVFTLLVFIVSSLGYLLLYFNYNYSRQFYRLFFLGMLVAHVSSLIISYFLLNPLHNRQNFTYTNNVRPSDDLVSNQVEGLFPGNTSSIWLVRLPQLSTIFHSCRYRILMNVFNNTSINTTCQKSQQSDNHITQLPATDSDLLQKITSASYTRILDSIRLQAAANTFSLFTVYNKACILPKSDRAVVAALSTSLIQEVVFIETQLNDTMWIPESSQLDCTAVIDLQSQPLHLPISLFHSMQYKLDHYLLRQFAPVYEYQYTDMAASWMVLPRRAQAGWYAAVNDHPEHVFIGQFFFHALMLNKGANHISTWYIPPLASIGMAISLIGFCVCLIALVLRYFISDSKPLFRDIFTAFFLFSILFLSIFIYVI